MNDEDLDNQINQLRVELVQGHQHLAQIALGIELEQAVPTQLQDNPHVGKGGNEASMAPQQPLKKSPAAYVQQQSLQNDFSLSAIPQLTSPPTSQTASSPALPQHIQHEQQQPEYRKKQPTFLEAELLAHDRQHQAQKTQVQAQVRTPLSQAFNSSSHYSQGPSPSVYPKGASTPYEQALIGAEPRQGRSLQVGRKQQLDRSPNAAYFEIQGESRTAKENSILKQQLQNVQQQVEIEKLKQQVTSLLQQQQIHLLQQQMRASTTYAQPPQVSPYVQAPGALPPGALPSGAQPGTLPPAQQPSSLRKEDVQLIVVETLKAMNLEKMIKDEAAAIMKSQVQGKGPVQPPIQPPSQLPLRQVSQQIQTSARLYSNSARQSPGQTQLVQLEAQAAQRKIFDSQKQPSEAVSMLTKPPSPIQDDLPQEALHPLSQSTIRLMTTQAQSRESHKQEEAVPVVSRTSPVAIVEPVIPPEPKVVESKLPEPPVPEPAQEPTQELAREPSFLPSPPKENKNHEPAPQFQAFVDPSTKARQPSPKLIEEQPNLISPEKSSEQAEPVPNLEQEVLKSQRLREVESVVLPQPIVVEPAIQNEQVPQVPVQTVATTQIEVVQAEKTQAVHLEEKLAPLQEVRQSSDANLKPASEPVSEPTPEEKTEATTLAFSALHHPIAILQQSLKALEEAVEAYSEQEDSFLEDELLEESLHPEATIFQHSILAEQKGSQAQVNNQSRNLNPTQQVHSAPQDGAQAEMAAINISQIEQDQEIRASLRNNYTHGHLPASAIEGGQQQDMQINPSFSAYQYQDEMEPVVEEEEKEEQTPTQARVEIENLASMQEKIDEKLEDQHTKQALEGEGAANSETQIDIAVLEDMKAKIQQKLLQVFTKAGEKKKATPEPAQPAQNPLSALFARKNTQSSADDAQAQSSIKMPHLKGNQFRFAHGEEMKYKDQVNMKLLDKFNLKAAAVKEEEKKNEPVDPNAFQERKGKMMNKLNKNQDLRAQLRKLERQKLEKRMLQTSHDLATRTIMGNMRQNLTADVTGQISALRAKKDHEYASKMTLGKMPKANPHNKASWGEN